MKTPKKKKKQSYVVLYFILMVSIAQISTVASMPSVETVLDLSDHSYGYWDFSITDYLCILIILMHLIFFAKLIFDYLDTHPKAMYEPVNLFLALLLGSFISIFPGIGLSKVLVHWPNYALSTRQIICERADFTVKVVSGGRTNHKYGLLILEKNAHRTTVKWGKMMRQSSPANQTIDVKLKPGLISDLYIEEYGPEVCSHQ